MKVYVLEQGFCIIGIYRKKKEAIVAAKKIKYYGKGRRGYYFGKPRVSNGITVK